MIYSSKFYFYGAALENHDSSIHGLSIEQKRHFLVWKYEQEGVAPPCNLPLLGLQNI